MTQTPTLPRRLIWAFATAIPAIAAILVLCGLSLGGGYLWVAFFWLAFLLVGRPRIQVTAHGFQTALPVGIAILHFAILGLAVAKIPTFPFDQSILGFFTAGLYLGHVSVPAAHELIHRPQRGLFWLGACIYTSLLFGHHSSAHRLVHHVHVGTPDDPNTARFGQSIFRFVPRAWVGSFWAGLAAERRHSGRSIWATPYPFYVVGGLSTLGFAYALAGATGAVCLVLLAFYATIQLLTSDYVQHYGLFRKSKSDGKPDPVTAAISWDAPPGPADALMLNAPHHARHHMQPYLHFVDLTTPQSTPRLPYSLTVMGMIAFVPPLWRRLMHPRLAALGRLAVQERA